MTWRERNAVARKRGRFTEQDRRLAMSSATCGVGESWDHNSYISTTLPGENVWLALSVVGCRHSAGFTHAVLNNLFSEADRFLDLIEDRVLALKRDMGSGT